MRISNEAINMAENDTDFLQTFVTDNKTGVSYKSTKKIRPPRESWQKPQSCGRITQKGNSS
jgi:hypothetical protein